MHICLNEITRQATNAICMLFGSKLRGYMCTIQTTVLAILDTMIQPLEGEPNTYIVYYHILDGDQHGRAPNCRTFDSSEKSCLHKISKSDNKVFSMCCKVILTTPIGSSVS